MSLQASDTAVQASVEVEAPIKRAFAVFTEDIGSWWNPDHHILQTRLAEIVFEPRVGGHVYDRGVDGSECRWARVLAYDPPHRLVISWDISLHWQLETDHQRTSEVEVRFTALAAAVVSLLAATARALDRTLVELEHRHIDRHGDGWEGMRGAVGSPGGWPAGMQAFAERIRTG